MAAGLPSILPGTSAYALDGVVFVYYFVRGFTVTSMYVWVRENMVQRDAERLSSNMGLLGQVGALLSNSAMFVLVTQMGQTL